MIPESYRPLFDRLLERTKADQVNWKPTADDKTFAVHVGDFTLTLRWGVSYEDNQEFVVLELVNEKGKQIDSFSVDESASDWDDMIDLHNRARRKAIRLDEALGAIMRELQGDKPVGGAPPPNHKTGSSPFDADDDDLPF